MRQFPPNKEPFTCFKLKTRDGKDIAMIDKDVTERMLSGLLDSVKPTEFIEMSHDDEFLDYIGMLSQCCSPDILISGQIPVPSLEILDIIGESTYKMQVTFDPPSEIMKLQKEILDGELLLNPSNLPIIGSIHVHKEPMYRGGIRFNADIPILMDFYWDEEKFATGLSYIINIRGRVIEEYLESLRAVVLADKYGFDYMPDDHLREYYYALSDILYDTIQLATNAYHLWYATQISLLNPLNKEYTRTTVEAVQESVKVKGGKKQKKLPKKKYIKRIYLDFAKMNELGICNEKTKHKYSKPIWWVMGHWRTYSKTGKRVFIQGYWKGALRDLKSVEPRERELVMEEE